MLESFAWGTALLAFLPGATPIAPDRAIAIIEGLERATATAEWSFHRRQGQLRVVQDPHSLEFSALYAKGRVLFEPTRGRYRVEQEVVTNWVGGAAPFGAAREAIAFDGAVIRETRYFKPGMEIPTAKDHGTGQVLRPGETRSLLSREKRELPTPLTVFPPSYFWNRRLSEHLREVERAGHPFRVTEDESGVWHIATIDLVSQHPVLIHYHPGRSGMVVGAEWGKDGNIWRHQIVELQQLDNGFWVPKTAFDLFLLDRRGTRTDFTDIKMNHRVPDEAFVLEFPIGVRVDDHIEKQTYIVGTAPKDEAAAVREFIIRHNLSASAPPSQWSWGSIAIVAGNATLALALTAFLLLRRHRRRAAAVGTALLSLASLSASQPCWFA